MTLVDRIAYWAMLVKNAPTVPLVSFLARVTFVNIVDDCVFIDVLERYHFDVSLWQVDCFFGLCRKKKCK